jgi:hypothetical protein
MPRNNLRIAYNSAILSVASDGSTASNVLNNFKSRTDTASTFTLTLAPTTGPVVLVALLPETNTAVTMTASFGTGPTVISKTEPTVSEFNASLGYGGGKYVTSYLTLPSNTTTITVTFSSVVKVSRIFVSPYWSPAYNTGFGMQVGFEDSSSSERLQSGDLYTTIAPRNKTLSFDLPYMNSTDKSKLFDIVKSLGKARAMFVSLFPEDDDPVHEQAYSIYGKLSGMPNISHSTFRMYASSLQLEEI